MVWKRSCLSTSVYTLSLKPAYCFRYCQSKNFYWLIREYCFSSIKPTNSTLLPILLLHPSLSLTRFPALLLGKASENAVAVINGPWGSGVPLPAHYWWAVQLHLSPPQSLPPLPTPSVSKLVRPDALPAHAQMQITQQRRFISNQTRDAAEHPGSSVPTETLYLRGSD